MHSAAPRRAAKGFPEADCLWKKAEEQNIPLSHLALSLSLIRAERAQAATVTSRAVNDTTIANDVALGTAVHVHPGPLGFSSFFFFFPWGGIKLFLCYFVPFRSQQER